MIPRPAHDPRTLARAVEPGRVRGIGVDLYAAALGDPRHATGLLRRGLRDARALHSRERRFVADALFDLIRWGPLLDAATGAQGPAALRRWLAWCVHLGAPVEGVRGAWDGPETPWEAAADLDGVLAASGPSDALLTGLQPADAAHLRASLGDALSTFVEASNARAPTVVRLPPTASVARVVAELARSGVPAAPSPLSPWGVRLPPRAPPEALRGLPTPWELMDDASQLVALAVDARPGARVLDRCAGAGGKTLALGAAMAGRGALVATDVRPHALRELSRRARDARLPVRTAVLPAPELGVFDRVLVDAPCTGTGVWRRHPELRWRLPHLPELLSLQATILDEAAAAVAPGGLLVYATCSVLREEDEDQAARLTAAHPELEPVPAWAPLTEELRARVAAGPYVRTLPHVHGADGFFVAAWRRR